MFPRKKTFRSRNRIPERVAKRGQSLFGRFLEAGEELGS